MKHLIIVILLCLVSQIQSRSFFYSGNLQKTSYYQCYKTNGFTRIALDLIYQGDQINEDNTQNFYNALSAGVAVETVIAPYRCRSVEEEIEFMKANIKFSYIDKFWLLVGADPDGCSWQDYSPQENCQYLLELMIKMRSLNLSIGIFTKIDLWISVFGSQTACPELNHLPLWWIPYDSEDDDQPNFNSYNQIGGWKVPYMKLFEVVTICGQEVIQNYYV